MSGAGSAQLDTVVEVKMTREIGGVARAESLRLEAAERLADHRLRRGARHAAAEAALVSQRTLERAETAGVTGSRTGKRAGVAAAVAERYAHSPSYRAVLAEEALRAIERAQAEAAVATRNAEAVAIAHRELLAELEKWTAPQSFTAETAETLAPTGPILVEPAPVELVAEVAAPVTSLESKPTEANKVVKAFTTPITEVSSAGITVKLYEDLPRTPVDEGSLRRGGMLKTIGRTDERMHEEEALEEEIAFRQAPVFDDFRVSGPLEPIAANLLEFPRQLVAPKRARPRYAEGPLRDDAPSEWQPRGSQLRIFEVGTDFLAPVSEPVSTAPEWNSIWLDAHTVTPMELVANDETVLLPSLLPPATADVHLRVMAAAVDVLLVGTGVVGFIALAVRCAGSVPTGPNAAVAAAVVFALLYVIYHVLFFSLSGQTPGMRYARIGLCTFTDENPSRAAMRRRVLAMIVAATPLGLGLLWVWLDDDRLGWHDRMSRMYQRAY